MTSRAPGVEHAWWIKRDDLLIQFAQHAGERLVHDRGTAKAMRIGHEEHGLARARGVTGQAIRPGQGGKLLASSIMAARTGLKKADRKIGRAIIAQPPAAVCHLSPVARI